MKGFEKIIVTLIVVASLFLPVKLSSTAQSNNSGRLIVLSSSEEQDDFVKDIRDAIEEAKSEISKALESGDNAVHIRLSNRHSDDSLDLKLERPYLGVYTSNLTLSKARELGYTNRYYGVLITGTGANSPARLYRIMTDDILMSINDTKISDDTHLTRVLGTYYVNDVVTLELFRDGKIIKMDVELGSRNRRYTRSGSTIVQEEAKVQKKKHSVGYLGGSWIPMWLALDMEDVNELLTRMEFKKLDENGIFLNGGGGKIAVGKGYFLGLMGAGYSIDRKANVVVSDGDQNVNVIRRMKYDNSFWGFTLDKRFALSSKLIFSTGVLIGGANQSLEIGQTDGDYDWTNLHNQMNNNFNSYASFKKSYIAVQPRAEVMYRLLSWLSLRAEGGYMYGYSYHQDWKTELCGDVFQTVNSPNTPYQGYSFSVGPWFGF